LNKEESTDEEMDVETYLRSLDLEDFKNCNDTREIMICEHYDNFEKKLKPLLVNIYSNYNYSFRENNLFGKDWDNELGESFAALIYNYISINYDVSIFYDCPNLAIELLSNKEKKFIK
jgi:hypothetical protein